MSRAIVQQQHTRTPNDDLFEIITLGNEVTFDIVEHNNHFMIEINVVKDGNETLKSWYFDFGMLRIIDNYLEANNYFKMGYIKHCSKIYQLLVEARAELVGDGRAPFDPC